MPSRLIRFGLAALVATLLSQTASAQRAPIGVPPDLHSGNLRSDDGTISYCIDDRIPGWEVDRDIALAIADSLLLEPRFVYITEELGTRSQDYMGVPENVLFILLDDKCDAFAGMPIGDRIVHPEFVTPSPPYMTTHYVIASRVDGIDALADFEAEDSPRLGVPVQSPMTGSLAYYSPQTRIHVFRNEAILLDGIIAEKVPAGIFLETTLRAMLEENPDAPALSVHPATGLPGSEWLVGMLLLNNRTYMRELLSDGIRTLTADGTIDAILRDAGLSP